MNIIPKRGVIGGTLTAVALALILSFKTPTASGLANVNSGGTTNGTGSQAQGSGTGTGKGSTYSGQLTGQAVQIPFGTVQVQVTMQNGQITDVQALQLPSDQQRSYQIGQYAAPQLRSEVLQAQSAQVNTISGATYTSQGYLQSLQSALDQIPA
jgi:uncharacterized protein with FMN-binding domain